MSESRKKTPECEVVTCPLSADSETPIFLNVDGLGDYSSMKVELQSKEFAVIPGYSADDCIEITENGLRTPVRWKSKAKVEAFGHPFRIRVQFQGIRIEDIRLYAVYAGE